MILGALLAVTAPAPAAQLGLNRSMYDVVPQVSDIGYTETPSYIFFSGQWYNKRVPDRSYYSESKDGIKIDMGGELSAVTHHSRPGALPPITADKAFYIEFVTSLSSNNEDHWPAVWLMPIEHDGLQTDTQPGAGERWVEMDVDEGGFAPGTHGVVIEWAGTWPHYSRNISKNGDSYMPLDRTRPHAFGLSFAPASKMFTWWLDGVATHSASVAWMPSYHYYPIISAQTHGKNVPYSLNLFRLSAWH